jgi:hypothetical protein
LLVRWFSRPARIAAEYSGGGASLADAGHEQGLDRDEIAHAAEWLDMEMEAILGPAESRHVLTARRFWTAFGCDVRAGWYAASVLLGVAAAILTVAHFWKHGRADTAVFLCGCAVVAFQPFGSFSVMHERWRATGVEQSLLLLTPGWPSRRELKGTLLRVVWTGVPQAFTVLVLLCLFATFAGWVQPRTALCVIAAFACTLAVSLATFLSYFVYATLPRRAWAPLLILLCGTVGAALVLFAWMGSLPMLIAGLLLAWVPLAVVLAVFAWRPLQFPVQPRLRRGG